MQAEITNIEYYFPQRRVSNEDLKKAFPDSDFDRFEEKVGIKFRYWVDENETALDLAEKACLRLFSKIDKSKIDFIILCTQSPEYILPTTACVLQDRLGVDKSIGALDFNLGCSGYIYGLSLAKGLIESGQCRNVMLVTAETYSKFLHLNDKSNRAIFGDAATATLISNTNNQGVESFLFGTDGSGADKLIIKNGGARSKYENAPEILTYGTNNSYTNNNLYMNGPEIFNFTIENIPSFTLKLLEKNNMSLEQADFFLFHQANAFMLEFLRKKTRIPKHKFIINIEDGGNTVSNTIPIALKRFSDSSIINSPRKIVLVGFGVGLSWGGAVVTLQNNI